MYKRKRHIFVSLALFILKGVKNIVNASFHKRAIGGFIDFSILLFLLYVIGGFVLFCFRGENMNIQSSPFIILNMIIAPVELLVRMIKYPRALGDTSSYYMLLVILFLIETSYYFIMELLPSKGTIGHRCMKLRVCKINGSSVNVLITLARCCLKTISRYLFVIPFFLLLFTKNKQAFHDLLTKTIVVLK